MLTTATLEAVRSWHKPAEPITRADLEALRGWERPTVRCQLEGRAGTQSGRLIPDVNPWVEIWDAGAWRAEQFSWPLVLEVLNDPTAAPLWFWAK